MQSPTISIIMSVYNPQNPKRLRRAVRSLINQTFTDWELLLYDDGSCEQAAQRIRAAANMDERILYIRSCRNRGLAYALNVLTRCACGAFVARMDDDDIALPTRLAVQYAFLCRHPQYAWAGSNAELRDEKGVWGLLTMPMAPSRRDFLFNSPYIHPSVMFRRDVLLRCGGYQTGPAFSGCEDYELFMRLHRQGFRGYNLQQPLLQYFEDYQSHKRRTYTRRIREMKVRYHGFRSLGFSKAESLPYVAKPLLVGALPRAAHLALRKHWKRKKEAPHDSFTKKPLPPSAAGRAPAGRRRASG